MTEENAVAPVFGGKVNVADMKAMAARAQESAQNNPRGGAPNGSEYMNFSGKRGLFQIGKNKRTIGKDEIWIVDATSFEEGWVCWKGGQPQATRLANIYTGVPIPQPNMDEFGPFDGVRGEGWFQAKAMVLKSCDNDEQGYLKINSVSGVSAMAELIGAFSERAAAGLPAWPVITLDVEEFESQGYKNFKPKFDIVGWLSNAQLGELAGGASIDDLLGAEEPEKLEPPKTDPVATGRRRAR